MVHIWSKLSRSKQSWIELKLFWAEQVWAKLYMGISRAKDLISTKYFSDSSGFYFLNSDWRSPLVERAQLTAQKGGGTTITNKADAKATLELDLPRKHLI